MSTELSTSTPALPVREIRGVPVTPEQAEYLTGFFAGVSARGLKFGDVEPSPTPALKVSDPDLIFEERVKRELHPLDAYPVLLTHAATNMPPDKEDLFRFKWNGLFYLAPNKDGYMARLRIPGGQLRSFQLRELAHIAKDLTTGYVQITTRANLQLRLIEPKNAPAVLERVQAIGLHTRGAGADNIRNLTANPTAGIDPHELIDTLPLCREMALIILNTRAFYDLPRKFNIAYSGGGLIGSVEDTNDIGCSAVVVDGNVHFRVAVGGATGHKAFALDLGILIPPDELNSVISAMIEVYLENGNRSDRKKARLKHLLDQWTLDEYREATERKLGRTYQRVSLEAAPVTQPDMPHSHVGVFPQKQKGLNYIGLAIPVGQITPKQMVRLAEIAELYGSGEVRLTVWQNLIIPNIPDTYVETVKKAVRRIGFGTTQSNLRSGFIACTGSAYCKFAQTATKTHALELMEFLEQRLELDVPINVHVTGCPNSCAQHYMGDIGLLGTKAKIVGESVDGYHVFVGGGFGKHQAVGRQVFTAVIFEDLKVTLERMLRGYLRHRTPSESFQSFTSRHDLNALQRIFSNGE